MKRRLSLVLVVVSLNAFAKPLVAITKFADETGNSRCNIKKIWKSDLGSDFQKQFVAVLNNYNRLRILNTETPKNFTPALPQYYMIGIVRSFDQCATPKRNPTANVVIQIRVINSKTGTLAFSYESNVNASGSTGAPDFHRGDLNSEEFKASPLGQATHASINELAFRVEQALLSRKTAAHIIFKNPRKIASTEYQVKLIKKEPVRR